MRGQAEKPARRRGLTSSRPFVWGIGAAAVPIEGALAEDGRGPSIWDSFTRETAKVLDGNTGEPECGSNHRWSKNVALSWNG